MKLITIVIIQYNKEFEAAKMSKNSFIDARVQQCAVGKFPEIFLEMMVNEEFLLGYHAGYQSVIFQRALQ